MRMYTSFSEEFGMEMVDVSSRPTMFLCRVER